MIAGTEVPDDGQIIRQNGMKIAHLTQNPVFPEGRRVSFISNENIKRARMKKSNFTCKRCSTAFSSVPPQIPLSQ
jgi:ATPase subunit of ABC transporter with duplicated ATPase domains